MRVVIALGGNALLRRGEPMTAEAQRANVRIAAPMLAAVARRHQLVLTHGNGPQVGLLALQGLGDSATSAFPLDVLGAQTEGMIGYVIEQELGNVAPHDTPIATVLTMTEVDPDDPAFLDPTKFVGPVYEKRKADLAAVENGWRFRQDGEHWRRVVPSPRPRHIVEIRSIRWLLDRGVVVICAGGGGIPTVRWPGDGRQLAGVEAVIDKDLTGELLAREVDADLFVMATDVAGVFRNWHSDSPVLIGQTTPDELNELSFPAGSMGPKVLAAAQFVERTGRRAAIGALADIESIVDGKAGTQVLPGKERA